MDWRNSPANPESARSALLSPGKGWIELIHQILLDQHDLVVVGGGAETGLWHALFGNTSTHLLRQCPCPVWVARPMPEEGPRHILVASNLTPASEAALQQGIALLHLAGGARGLQVMHMVEYPLDRVEPHRNR